MFFKKAKRIKELQTKNDTLEKDVIMLRALLSKNNLLVKTEDIAVEKYSATRHFPPWLPKEIIDDEIRFLLSKELFPLMKLEYDHSLIEDTILARASIRVVKER